LGTTGIFGKPIALTEDEVWAKGMEELRSGIQFDPDAPIFHDSTNASAAATVETPQTDPLSTRMRAIEDDEENEGVVPNFFAQPQWRDQKAVRLPERVMIL
jgi:hypothetical protein